MDRFVFLRWFRSYVAGRLQHVHRGSTTSTAVHLICNGTAPGYLPSCFTRLADIKTTVAVLCLPSVQYRQFVCLLSAGEPPKFPAPTHNEQRPSMPRHFCTVTRGFQTASQNIPIFPFIPGHSHLTCIFLLHLWT